MAKKRIDEVKEDRKAKRQRGYIMQKEDYLEEISDTLAIMCDHMDIISDYCWNQNVHGGI